MVSMGTKRPPKLMHKKSITFEHGVFVAIFLEVSLKNCFHTFFCVVVVVAAVVDVIVEANQKTF